MKWTPTLVMTILLGQDQDRGRGARDEDSGLITLEFFVASSRSCDVRDVANVVTCVTSH